MTSEHSVGFEPADRLARDRGRVRKQFWIKLKRFAANLPFDFIPDMLPVLGFTDDAAVLAAAIRTVASHITSEHRNAARAALKRGVESSDHLNEPSS
jgi:hypothetical protein